MTRRLSEAEAMQIPAIARAIRGQRRPTVTAKSVAVPGTSGAGPTSIDNYVGEFKLVLPIRTAQLNDLIRIKGGRWKGAYNKQKQAMSDLVRQSWQRHGAPRIKGAYRTAWVFVRSDTRTDPDNIFTAGIKVVLDALVWCGAIENDSWRFHKSPLGGLAWEHDKTMDCVQVVVTSANAESF